MALVLKDRVKESSSSSGTGSITLGGAFPGYQTFATAIASGSTVYYTIHNLTAGLDNEWEVGVGTFTSPSTLSRDTVLSSSTGGAKVSFTSGTSGLEVFVTQPAEEAIYVNQATGKVEAFGNGTTTIDFTNINASNVVMVSGTISTNAANATDITNKSYVDGVAATGLSYHTAVQAATTQSLAAQTGGTVTYNQPGGAGNGVGATITLSVALNTLDGYSLSNTNRILVKDETNQTYNGVYTWATGGTVLTRSTDTDTYGKDANQLSLNDYFYVQNGNTNKGTAWVVDSPTGTITFGTSNIAFALFSSAQVYSAGTGLTLANTTFSISNTAVTANTYGNDGSVGQFTVNAQGQLTAASTVPINASAITTGTLANARTTAASANGASTIVARDANGSFSANVITAVDVNSTNVTATTGSFTNISGNGSSMTAINASNITSGTISNARTTGSASNSASTLVLRDANGSFGSNVISAASFSGDGTAITAINASNISSGTIANARTTASSSNGASTIVQRDSGGNFSANTVTAAVIGDISGGTNINASNISSGTIANARTTASSSNGASTIVLRGASGEFSAGAITGSSLAGNGASITALNATAITTGTIDNARTTASASNGANTIVLRDASGDFAADIITANGFTGNGASLTGINASNISSGTIGSAYVSGSYTGITGVGTLTVGTWNANVIANAYTTANSANGASTIVARDASGNFTANAGTFTSVSGNGVALTAINASNISSGTIANARTTASDANGASTIVSRDANGSFTANVVTATTFSGNGASLTGINASNISSGTIANARTTAATANGASTIVLRGTSGEFSAGAITAVSISGDGSALSAINASNISSGTVNTARISGSYTGITGVGTLTAGTWNATTIGAQYGGTGSANLTANNVILGNGASSVQFVAPGTNGNVLTSNGTTWTSAAAGGGFAAGTVMLFAQTAAPTGWTKNTTTGNDSAIRVVTGTASTGGSVAFTTAFASNRALSITAVTGSAGATTLTTPQIPSHSHPLNATAAGGPGSGISANANPSGGGSTGNTGGDGSHTHPFSFSSATGTVNLAVQYIDVIRATKD